jgi:KUP system potassium uptake protein
MVGMARKQTTSIGLMLGALGVVFGDIGTSPLYALKVIFGLTHTSGISDRTLIYGLLSLLLWTVTLIVSVKYIGYVMRANNKGEGGVLALVSLVNSSKLKHRSILIGLGLVGVTLFYGDSVVTPAISVLSAVEGLQIVAPELSVLVVPLTLIMLLGLFGIQRFGTGTIGKFFGPVMLTWFATIAAGGTWQIIQHPDILQALSPVHALGFAVSHPLIAFLSMGAVILAVTGAEALYIDMGHFGRQPIARTWLFVVFPALALCYLGQGALIVNTPAAASNPFFLLFPAVLHIPVIILATAATLIASQAVISGAFSLTRQAIQLNFLPRMLIKQTSATHIGQIFMPFVNTVLLILVALLVVAFGSSQNLAGAYGVAVSGTLLIDSVLFIVTARYFWHRSKTFVGIYALVFLTLEVILVAASASKIIHGGWLPLALASLILVVMYTWISGQRIAAKQRRATERPLREFITEVQQRDKSLVRLPGQAVYIGHHAGLTPSALRTAVEELHELHEKVVIVYVETSSAAHVPAEERAVFDALGYADGISQVTITYGFHDSPNIPKTLDSIRHLSPELEFDPFKAIYFISLSRIIVSRRHGMPGWQKSLYAIMSRNALSTSDYYHLPLAETVEMRSLIKV